MSKFRCTDFDVDKLIDDRTDEGIFRVNRGAFLDPFVFELEMSRIFESTWIFIGLESQIEKPHDFMTTHIGRQPVIVTRNAEGEVGCFLNSCRHRGSLLCTLTAGNQKFHVCRYHGWSYDSSGKNVLITDREDGRYPRAFDADNHDLVPVARLESYRGFIFASLVSGGTSLSEHLGEASVLLDLIADQAPNGLEYVPGSVNYVFNGNWKLQFENGLDFYHFSSTHSSYVDILNQRARRTTVPAARDAGNAQTYEDIELGSQGTFSFPRGHSVMWSTLRPGQAQRQTSHDGGFMAGVLKQIGEPEAKWIAQRQRNLTIFPNLQIIDLQAMQLSLQLRTWHPLTVDKTLMVSHCLAPKGESREARRIRIRRYEDFFNASGLATSDDNATYQLCQDGFRATAAGGTQGYVRGLGDSPTPANDHAAELNLKVMVEASGSIAFGDETCFHAGYREWLRLLRAHDSA